MLTPAIHRPISCVSDLVFDEWAAGELTAERALEVETHVQSCARCTARRDALADQSSAFLERAGTLLPTSGPRARSARLRQTLLAYSGAAALAAAAVLLVMRLDTESGTRSKGSTRIGFFVKRGERVYEGQSGERVNPGDRLRFVLSSPAARHVAIVARDARGTASIYYPEGRRTVPMGPAEQLALDSSIELDSTLGKERIYAVFCDAPLELENVRRTLERRGELALPEGCAQESIEINKEPSE